MSVPKWIFVGLGAVVLIGTLAYLQLAFEGSDVKTAIRLVEEAKVRGTSLGAEMEKILPRATRLCEAHIVNGFYGHMEVACRDAERASRVLRWKVNVVDGMVLPANESATRLGKGEPPWK